MACSDWRQIRNASVILLTLLAFCVDARAEWRAKQAPLMTRWAAEVNPTNALSEYPRPQLVREQWINLNGLWDYAIVSRTNGSPSAFEGKILVPFPVESALSGVMRRLDANQLLWYRRTIVIPESWRKLRVRLHFGAVDWQARVFVNGTFVGQHAGGYDAFSFDITPHLHFEGEEEIRVEVMDPTEGDQPRGKQSNKPEGIFYTPASGIWQTVWLEPVPEVSIDSLKFTPDLNGRALNLHVRVNSRSENLRVQAVALAQGVEVGRVSGMPNTQLVLPLENVRTWSPDNPFLYDLRVSLMDGNQTVDRVESYFGMREVSLRKGDDGFSRITLNNEPLFQIGTLDQGFWPDGIYTAPTDAALRSDIEFLKSAGFNLTRKHVKVEPARWYYWADKLGLLVWQDMPSGNNATSEGRREFEAELLHVVRDLHNHPSVIVWVLFNESWGQYETERLVQLLKTADPSRLVDNASGWTDARVGDLVDIHSYPGPDSPDPESRRASVLGEFGGLGLPVPNHTWSSRSWGYLMLESADELSARYAQLLKRVWNLHDLRGLSAAVYTQTTDVETECNGLLTYDRVPKVDPAIIRVANQIRNDGRPMKVIMPDALLGRALWRFTTSKPEGNWMEAGFDDSSWDEGLAAFGVSGTPGVRPNTVWDTPDIWLRREFHLDAADRGPFKFRVFHDEDAEIYLNGVLAARLNRFITEYAQVAISPEAAAALRPGKNVVAVHCHQTSGGQGIDVGILMEKPTAEASGETSQPGNK